MRPMRVRWGLKDDGGNPRTYTVVAPEKHRRPDAYGYGTAIEWSSDKGMVLILTTEKPGRFIQLSLELVELVDDENAS